MRILYVNAVTTPGTGRLCRDGFLEGLRAGVPDLELIEMDIFYGARVAAGRMGILAREHAVDGVVLSGSGKNTSDREDPWIREYLEGLRDLLQIPPRSEDWLGPSCPVLGVCFGHQALACALGGETARVGLRMGVEPMLPLAGAVWHPVLAKLTGGRKALKLIVTHGDQVVRLPRDFYPLLTSDYCEFQAMTHAKYPIFSLQPHPELSKKIKYEPEEEGDWKNVSDADLDSHEGRGLLAHFARWCATQ